MKWPKRDFFEGRIERISRKHNQKIKEQNNAKIRDLSDFLKEKHEIDIDRGFVAFMVNHGYEDVAYSATLMTLNALMHLYRLWQSNENLIEKLSDCTN